MKRKLTERSLAMRNEIPDFKKEFQLLKERAIELRLRNDVLRTQITRSNNLTMRLILASDALALGEDVLVRTQSAIAATRLHGAEDAVTHTLQKDLKDLTMLLENMHSIITLTLEREFHKVQSL